MELENYLKSIGKHKEGMTFAEIAEALKDAKLDTGATVGKDLYDRTASELAKLKKALAEKQTDDEKKKAAEDERDALIKELTKKVAVSEQTEAFVKGGYDAETAKKMAQYSADGKMDKFIAEQVAWATKQKESIKASVTEELMKGQNPPKQGDGEKKGDSAEIAFAKSLTAHSAEQNKVSEDTVKNYFGGR